MYQGENAFRDQGSVEVQPGVKDQFSSFQPKIKSMHLGETSHCQKLQSRIDTPDSPVKTQTPKLSLMGNYSQFLSSEQ